MMGRQTGDQSQLFYLFNLEQRIPASHLLRRINSKLRRFWQGFVRSWRRFIARSGVPRLTLS